MTERPSPSIWGSPRLCLWFSLGDVTSILSVFLQICTSTCLLDVSTHVSNGPLKLQRLKQDMDFPSQTCSSLVFPHLKRWHHHLCSCSKKNLGMMDESFLSHPLRFTSIHQPVMSAMTSETSRICSFLSVSAPTALVQCILSAGWLT